MKGDRGMKSPETFGEIQAVSEARSLDPVGDTHILIYIFFGQGKEIEFVPIVMGSY